MLIWITLSSKLNNFIISFITCKIGIWEHFNMGLYIVVCQAHPALVKIGPALVLLFTFDSLLACIHVLDYLSDTY